MSIFHFAQAAARSSVARYVFRFVCPRWVDGLERVGRFVSLPHFPEVATISGLYFTTDLFSQFDRLHQQMATLIRNHPSSIRTDRLPAFPQINIGTTDDTVEIVAFASGIYPKQLDVSIDKGLLAIAGERAAVTREVNEATLHYARQRFSG